jgi:iron(III) transport system substrate-binding protein
MATTTTAAALVLALCACPARVAAGGPRTASTIVEAAEHEGVLVVYATTDAAIAAPLLRDFGALHPGIEVRYHDLNSTELHDRFLGEVASGAATADFLWSSSMDLQMKLANDGFAAAYASPEAGALPPWAVWNAEAYGTTFEPVAFAYNKRLLGAAEVPRSHAELAKLLRTRAPRFERKIATYDPERTGIGFLLMTQDARIDPAFEEQARTYASARVQLYTTTGAMLDRVASGEHLLAFNVLSSYAVAHPRDEVGIVYPRDYTLVLSRIALVPKAAAHPNAARTFLDYLLSARGQEIIANQVQLGAIRLDVNGAATAAALSQTLGAALRPISIGPSLLVYLDAAKRRDFLRRWQHALGAR